ncbi:MAG: penicillin-binding protein 1C [Saprospiraceae bacterium]|nr:penicillin-binding protein 1C [Saprospiraceae bacterium]
MRFINISEMSLKKKIIVFAIIVFGIAYLFSLPEPLFKSPTSTIVYSKKGNLIGAHIAADGQWRFKPGHPVPERIEKSIIAFEDKRFYYHPGVDILRVGAAAVQNIRKGRFVSGASTISMQVIRISRKNPSRNFFNKILEMILATRLELRYSKRSILRLYAANAPYGGNVVGFEAASWRYFGLPPGQLSWAQSATLAVLPNSPALIHPGSNRNLLLKKRNKLLKKLYDQEIFDRMQYELALTEEIPPKPFPLPELAPHLTDKINILDNGDQVTTFIDEELQQEVSNIVSIHQKANENNEIFNCAVLVVRNEDGAVLSYIGNTEDPDKLHDNYVDMIMANRSGGSILKPLLFVSAFEDGLITPYQILPDIPLNIDGFTPENFDLKYSGVVSASDALSQSLNVPSVILLKNFGISGMISRLKDFGLTTINKDADYYGLPLILGSPDVRLWELTGVYSSFARILNHYNEDGGKYLENDIRPPEYSVDKSNSSKKSRILDYAPVLSAGAIYQLFEIMTELRRPDEEGDWQEFSSSKKIAWKTGTSYGLKDAWSIGVSKNYTVGVWVGNSNGKGRPGLIGAKIAAPILFDVFGKLSNDAWFATPHDDLREALVCSESGFLFSENCEYADTVLITRSGNKLSTCPYHRTILTDNSGEFLIHEQCSNMENTQLSKRFVLPPTQEYYYRIKNPSYRGMPSDFLPCSGSDITIHKSMEFIYPNKSTKVIIPKDFDGKKGRVIFKIAHSDPKSKVFWHIDDKFLKSTVEFHNIEVLIGPGKHLLSATDDKGYQIFRQFEVLY